MFCQLLSIGRLPRCFSGMPWIVPIVDRDRLELVLDQTLTDCDDLFSGSWRYIFPIVVLGLAARCAVRAGFFENAEDDHGLFR